jgi:hypothetical protein
MIRDALRAALVVAVMAATADRGGWLVDTPEGRLLMYREELIQR